MKSEVKYLPVAEAYERVTGYRPSPPTIQRWVTEGVIESWLIAGRRMTTIEAVERYVESTRIKPRESANAAAAASVAALDRELAS